MALDYSYETRGRIAALDDLVTAALNAFQTQNPQGIQVNLAVLVERAVELHDLLFGPLRPN